VLLHVVHRSLAIHPKYTMLPNATWVPQIHSVSVHAFSPTLLNEASMSYVRADGNQPAAPGDLPNASWGVLERQQLILHTKHRYKHRHFKRTLDMLV
jgi:hypothetical protein